jgi:hypothetical protein
MKGRKLTQRFKKNEAKEREVVQSVTTDREKVGKW